MKKSELTQIIREEVERSFPDHYEMADKNRTMPRTAKYRKKFEEGLAALKEAAGCFEEAISIAGDMGDRDIERVAWNARSATQTMKQNIEKAYGSIKHTK